MGAKIPEYCLLLTLWFAGLLKHMYRSDKKPLDLAAYKKDLKIWIEGLLHLFKAVPELAELGEERFKIHALVHLLEQVQRYAWFIPLSTETMESLNALIRTLILGSNRRNTSLTVAKGMAVRAGMDFLMSGAWIDPEGNLVTAGETCRQHLLENEAQSDPVVDPNPNIHVGKVGLATRDVISHRSIKSQASTYAWPRQMDVSKVWDLLFLAALSNGLQCWTLDSFASMFVESFKLVHCQQDEAVQVGWSIIYECGDGPVKMIKRGRLLDIVRVTRSMADRSNLNFGDGHARNCFAIISPYCCVIDGETRQNFSCVHAMTAEQLRSRVKLDRTLHGIVIDLLPDNVNIVPTSRIIQAFDAEHVCGTECGPATANNPGHQFAETPRPARKGDWVCQDDGRFRINHFRFSDPLPPVPPHPPVSQSGKPLSA